MPSRNWEFRIHDIINCIQAIQTYTNNMSFDQFCKDQKTIDAVIRNFEIIGEAANHVPNEIREHYRNIPWKLMIGMRNEVLHAYFGIDLEVVWETVLRDLPALSEKLTGIVDTK